MSFQSDNDNSCMHCYFISNRPISQLFLKQTQLINKSLEIMNVISIDNDNSCIAILLVIVQSSNIELSKN